MAVGILPAGGEASRLVVLDSRQDAAVTGRPDARLYGFRPITILMAPPKKLWT
jgi:hypothetical protein